MKEYIILNKSIDFSVGVKNYCNSLYFTETNIANQLLRSDMAIGANIAEAQQAESRSDFIHKMKIASKEAGETFCEEKYLAFIPTLSFPNSTSPSPHIHNSKFATMKKKGPPKREDL